DNIIKTSKYNVLTFIPLNLYEQFHRAANIYFLFIIILQMIPAISTLPWFVIMLPLIFLFVIRGIRDLIDDLARHKSDKAINNRPCEILKGQSLVKKKWKDILSGDIVRLQKNDFVPADLLLLYTSEPNSLCYVETADIDGETNLKFKQALIVTHQRLCTVESLSVFDGKITCEKANSNMHNFTGTLEWNGEKYSLDNNCILLRGCRIRNTETCYGLVIYAGIDTKIMKNSGKVKIKNTKLDVMMNNIVIIIFGMLITCAVLLAIASGYWSVWFKEKHSYIPPLSDVHTPAQSGFLAFWGYVILLSTMVPLSMYITLELIHLIHSMFINWDEEMYFAARDSSACARSTSLNDLLGQVEYVFSDKTGTLTQNIMTFKKCCINGKTLLYNFQVASFKWNKYADKNFRFYDQSLIDMACKNKDGLFREFFHVLSICHTVIAERNGEELIYKAASPDEEALVTAARNMGYVFLSRTQDTISINEHGTERVYRVLALLDFSSVRKRMSVLVKDPNGNIKIYTKGADDVILRRIHSKCSETETTEKALQMFSQESLRTLCIAYKDIDVATYTEWIKQYYQASVALQNRAEYLERIYEEIEKDLQLLGATAIEDKLQNLVPETIQLLKDGNIKVWVLTGDKQETAINIGFSCRLISEDMDILTEEQICDILDEYWENNNNLSGNGQDLVSTNNLKKHRTDLGGRNIALVVCGDFLDLWESPKKDEKSEDGPIEVDGKKIQKQRSQEEEEKNLKEWAFVDLASQCEAVICCRVTPKQKSMIVQLVKKYKKATTLAIGDGANDVSMIKTADIGVGISGVEGPQAVQSSDYSVAQFSFLQRLLFIHGRFYDSWYLSMYSILFTSFPVLSMAVLEQDVSAKISLQFPELYKVGQSGSLFTYKTFIFSVLRGITTSLVSFFIPFGAFLDTADPYGICDYQAFAVTTATIVILSVTVQMTFEIRYWTRLSFIAVLLSPLLYFVLSFLTQTSRMHALMPSVFQFPDVSRNALSHTYIWLIILLGVIINTLPSLLITFFTKLISRNQIHMNKSYKAEMNTSVNTVAMKTPIKRVALPRRSSYAFSHKNGYADLITKGTSLRKAKPQEHTQKSQKKGGCHNSTVTN
ncbi:hypothetical protein GDO86_000972, partial [Hymenochirus boettgeri]